MYYYGAFFGGKVTNVLKFCKTLIEWQNYDRTLLKFIPNIKFDLIFCDPPFRDENINGLIELIAAKNLLKKNGIIILHRHKNTKETITTYFKLIDKRVYGLSKIIFGKF